MAILSAIQLAELRRDIVVDGTTIDFSKPLINAALQAIEDRIESSRSVLSSDIDTATTKGALNYIFTASQKKRMFALFMKQKFRRDT